MSHPADHPADRPEALPDDGQDKKALGALIGTYIDRLTDGEHIDPQEILDRHGVLGAAILKELETFVEFSDAAEAPVQPLGVLGDYTLRRQIGRGGMGVVYEAWENSMDRVVALKVLPAGVAADTRASARFMREAQAAGKLRHENVVGVYSTGVKEGTPWYAMEYVEGETLAQILRRVKGAEPETETPFGRRDDTRYFANLADAFADVADGLQHAHSKGVIHRDIKPSNLILDGEFRLRILDFGLAHLEGQESLTLSGDVVGTPLYMSPEQARRRKIPVDHRTDVYSLGVTMYEAICGRPPFRGRDHADTLSQIIERVPVEPRRINARVPRDLETIVLKCLRKDSTDRYGTAEALAQDLRRFVRGDPVEALAQSLWEKTARRLWRQRRLGLAVGAFLIVGLVALVVSNVLVARARDEARYDHYVSNMRLAMEDWRLGSYLRFSEILESHIPEPGAPDLRGWEWYYLESLRDTEAELLTIKGGAPLHTVAWSPDGLRLTAGGSDGAVQIWDVSVAPRGQSRGSSDVTAVLAFEFHAESAVDTIAWHPDGTRIAVACTEGTVTVWSPEGEEDVLSFRACERTSRPLSVAWSPDGDWLATCSAKELRIWHGRSGELSRDLSEELNPIATKIECLSWSPDGTKLAAGCHDSRASRGKVVVLDASSWRRLQTVAPFDYGTLALAWSSDGRWLAASGYDQQIEVWSSETWQNVRGYRTGHEGRSYSLAWKPDELVLASAGGNGIVKVWDPFEAKESTQLRGHAGIVRSVAWNADGTRLASASEDGTVKIWNPAAEQQNRVLPGEFPATWSRDGDFLAMERTGEGGVCVLDASSGEPVSSLGPYGNDQPRDLCFHPSRPLLAVAGERVSDVWDWEGGVVICRFGGDTDVFLCVDWSPDGELLVAGRKKDGVFVICDAQTGERRATLKGHMVSAVDAVWSPDGERLATTSADQWVRIWDRRTWRELHALRRCTAPIPSKYYGPMDGLSWSPDGDRLAAASLEGTIYIWDVATGDEVVKLSRHGARTLSVSWSPDGSRMASGSHDRTIKIWDVSTGRELLTLRGQRRCAASLQWHPDGKRLLSAEGFPDSVRIWDATSAYEE